MPTNPANKNFLSPLGYRFVLNRAPNLNFNVQRVSLPGISLGMAPVSTPFVAIKTPGKIDYTSFSITFRVSEDMDDYLELYNWMVALGTPGSFDQYNNENVYSDCKLMIMNSSFKENLIVNFVDAFPVGLSELQFNSTDTDVNYIECSADFAFTRYDITKTS